jgi:hypothetical protein
MHLLLLMMLMMTMIKALSTNLSIIGTASPIHVQIFARRFGLGNGVHFICHMLPCCMFTIYVSPRLSVSSSSCMPRLRRTYVLETATHTWFFVFCFFQKQVKLVLISCNMKPIQSVHQNKGDIVLIG